MGPQRIPLASVRWVRVSSVLVLALNTLHQRPTPATAWLPARGTGRREPACSNRSGDTGQDARARRLGAVNPDLTRARPRAPTPPTHGANTTVRWIIYLAGLEVLVTGLQNLCTGAYSWLYSTPYRFKMAGVPLGSVLWVHTCIHVSWL